MGYVLILLGICSIVVGLIGNKFMPADPVSGAGFSNGTPLPRWAGRLLFACVGLAFIVYGLISVL